MRFHTVIACVVVLLGCAASSSAQAVSLQFDNGLVTLNAQNAPVRTILAEWARLGGTRFLNAERIGGSPVTIELTAVPERQALEILLRNVAGYVVTQREGNGVSRLGGVAVLATSAAVRAPAPVTFGATTVQQQRNPQDDALNDPNADDRPGQRGPTNVSPFAVTPAATTTGGVVRVTPGTPNVPFGSVTMPDPAPAGAPGSPTVVRPPTTLQPTAGSSRPGEITPQPQQQPGQPNQR
jgi:hypothetical protein